MGNVPGSDKGGAVVTGNKEGVVENINGVPKGFDVVDEAYELK